MDRKCLNEIEIAVMVDYLLGEPFIPDERILEHVEGCFECKSEVIEVWGMSSNN